MATAQHSSSPPAAHGVALLLAILLATPALAHDTVRGRLVFADHGKPVVKVLDLDEGRVTHRFAVPRPNPRLETSEDGRFVFIVTGDGEGTIKVLDTGLRLESHGDHSDVLKGVVRLLDTAFTGERPGHVVSGGGWVSLFYDGPRLAERPGGAEAKLIDLASLDGEALVTRVWRSAGPQHGFAVPLGNDQWAVTMADPAYARGDPRAGLLPNGLAVLDAREEWRPMARFDGEAETPSCRQIHGHGSARDRHVFGCAAGDGEGTGLLVVSRTPAGIWTGRRLDYPDDRRVSTIRARPGAPVMVANYGRPAQYDTLLRIDPAAPALSVAEDVLPIAGGQAACRFALSADGRRVANLLADGTLRIYDLLPRWKEAARFAAVAPFDCSYGALTPRPSLAVHGGIAFVSDPLRGRIRQYSLNGLVALEDMEVGGMPENLAAGGSR